LNAGYSVAQLITMMEALLASDWHRERDQLTLSTIFATKPGGKTFEDQLDTWLARGENPSSSPAAGDASVTDAAVAAAKNTIRQTWGRDSKAANQLRDAAVLSLERHGWKVCSSSNGQPVFSRA
jgi:cobalamin biosynthesis Mg chelatase CobN